jgi:hypothetical protein
MRIRRAATLLVLTVLLPGSAQLAAGDRRIGRIALRGWLAAVATIALVGLLWAVHRPWALSLATTPLVLSLLAVALHAAALAWPLLLVDAWRLAVRRPCRAGPAAGSAPPRSGWSCSPPSPRWRSDGAPGPRAT